MLPLQTQSVQSSTLPFEVPLASESTHINLKKCVNIDCAYLTIMSAYFEVRTADDIDLKVVPSDADVFVLQARILIRVVR